MKIEQRKLDSIKPYPGNPRINDNAVDAVAESIRQFGFRQPIVVDAKGVIIAGHTRLKAALKLGLAKAPVHVAHDLTPAQVKALRLADNKSHELSTWDLGKLGEEFKDLPADLDLLKLGFTQEDIDAALEKIEDLPTLDLGAPPHNVMTNLEEMKKVRRAKNADVVAAHDTEHFLVIVYADRQAKELALLALGLDPAERYLAAADVNLWLKGTVGRRLSQKSPEVKHAGSQG